MAFSDTVTSQTLQHSLQGYKILHLAIGWYDAVISRDLDAGQGLDLGIYIYIFPTFFTFSFKWRIFPRPLLFLGSVMKRAAAFGVCPPSVLE